MRGSTMNPRYLLALVVVALSPAVAESAAPRPVALSVMVSAAPGCGPASSLRISPESVRAYASAALSRKGYTIVNDYRQARDGVEAKIDVQLCQFGTGGDVLYYAASVGKYAVGAGSAEASNVGRVAFSYGSAFVGYGGSAANDQEGKVRAGIQRVVEEWVASTF